MEEGELPPCEPLFVFLGEGVFNREEGPLDVAQTLIDASTGDPVVLTKPDDLAQVAERIEQLVEAQREACRGQDSCKLTILFQGFDDPLALVELHPVNFILGFSGLSLEKPDEESEAEEVRIGPGAAVETLHKWADDLEGASSASVRTLVLSDAHTYDGEAALAGVLPVIQEHAECMAKHKEFVKDIKVVTIPECEAVDPSGPQCSYYRRLMGSVDPEHHNLPLFLHCLTHQVELNIGSTPEEQLSGVEAEIDRLIGVSESMGEVWSGQSASLAKASVVPFKDGVLAADSEVELVGRVSCVDAEHEVLAATCVPGYKRRGLESDVQPMHERSAAQNTIYPFMPGIKPAQVERLLLLREFENLTNAMSPERSADYSSRYYSEDIEDHLLVQAMDPQESFVATRYYERLDALLVLHYFRCPPGRILWHSWRQNGDLRTLPGVLDHATRLGSEKPPEAAFDVATKDFGYLGVVEKSVIPGDTGVVLCWTAEQGDGPMDIGLTHLEAHTAKPRRVSKTTRVLKDGLVFGMMKDAAWEKRKPALAKAHAAHTAKKSPTPGEEGEGDEQAPEGSESDDDEKRLLHTQTFGVFWLLFPDQSRICVRMDHERQVSDSSDEYLGDLGVRFSYLSVSGRQVTVCSDGSIVQTNPLPQAGVLFGQPVPGGPDDVEATRTVTWGGAITRELISGRYEVYHHDGTYAWRNPLVSELTDRREKFSIPSIRKRLDRIIPLYKDPEGKPTKEQLLRGLPGHWIVVHRTGRRCARFPMPEPDRAKQMKSWFGAYEADGMMEYELPNAAAQVYTNPHNGEQVAISEYSVQYTENESGERHVALFGDATRIIWEKTKEGMEISTECPGRMPVLVRREVDAYVPKAKLKLFAPGGVVLEVIPQEMNEKGELIPADIRDPSKDVSNAAVLVRHPDGHIVKSIGVGAVDVLPRTEVRRKGGETEALRSVEKDGVYTANCAQDLLTTIDAEGNVVEITSSYADVKLAVSISGDDQLQSPRCEHIETPYLHPDVSFLPLPVNFPEPKLFVVYGDGRAEEFLSAERARDILTSASADPRNTIEVSDLQPPSRGLRVHTMYIEAEGAPEGFSREASREKPSGATLVRHLDEFPPVTSEVWAEFRQSFDRYATWATDHDDAHNKMGQELPSAGRRP
jgi:hypothetical protein